MARMTHTSAKALAQWLRDSLHHHGCYCGHIALRYAETHGECMKVLRPMSGK